jgi:hypothetical protein
MKSLQLNFLQVDAGSLKRMCSACYLERAEGAGARREEAAGWRAVSLAALPGEDFSKATLHS